MPLTTEALGRPNHKLIGSLTPVLNFFRNKEGHPPPPQKLAFVRCRISCVMGSDAVLCKYVLQDGLWDFLTSIPLSCSLQAPMQKFLNLNPNVKLPPVDTQELVAAILVFWYEGHRTRTGCGTTGQSFGYSLS